MEKSGIREKLRNSDIGLIGRPIDEKVSELTPEQINQIARERAARQLDGYVHGDETWEVTPPTIQEFIDSPMYLRDLLDPERGLFRGIREDLLEMFSETPDRKFKYNYAILIQAPGSGKSELCSIALSFLVVRLLCMRNPQSRLGQLPSSRIQLVNSSASGEQAKKVVYGYVGEKLPHIPFLQERGWVPDDTVESELRFPKNIYLTPTASTGGTVLGTNLYAVVMDELSEYQRTRDHNVAEEMYNKFHSRTLNRFRHEGTYYYILVSQSRYDDDFIERKFEEMKAQPNAYCKRRSHWEARPDIYHMPTFPVVYRDKMGQDATMEVPGELQDEYNTNPVVFIRNWGAMPSRVIRPFFPEFDRIQACFDDETRVDPLPEAKDSRGYVLPLYPMDAYSRLPQSFRGVPGRDYYAFTDLSLGEICKAGFCLGHKEGSIEIERMDSKLGRPTKESRPIIVVDLVTRFIAFRGRQIEFTDIREFIVRLWKERGFTIKTVGTDSWQSVDFRQIMVRLGFNVDLVALEGDVSVYQTLRDVVNETRLRCYRRENVMLEMGKLEVVGEKVTSTWFKDEVDGLCGMVNLAVRDEFISAHDIARATRPVMPASGPGMFGRGTGGGGLIPGRGGTIVPDAIRRLTG